MVSVELISGVSSVEAVRDGRSGSLSLRADGLSSVEVKDGISGSIVP